MRYLVTWALEVEAATPEGAGEIARERMLDREAVFDVFTVSEAPESSDKHEPISWPADLS